MREYLLKIAKRKSIGETAKEANRVRDMIVTYAFEGLREGFFDLAQGLRNLLEFEFVTADLKDEIVSININHVIIRAFQFTKLFDLAKKYVSLQATG